MRLESRSDLQMRAAAEESEAQQVPTNLQKNPKFQSKIRFFAISSILHNYLQYEVVELSQSTRQPSVGGLRYPVLHPGYEVVLAEHALKVQLGDGQVAQHAQALHAELLRVGPLEVYV